jgi:hypothetical protein
LLSLKLLISFYLMKEIEGSSKKWFNFFVFF